MEKRVVKGIFFMAIFIILILAFFKTDSPIVGRTIEDYQEGFGGPSPEDQKCMEDCVAIGCDGNNKDCMIQNSEKCGLKCGVDVSGPPTPADEGEACMQGCVVKGCDDYDFSCQKLNKDSCEDECDMKGDAPDESEMDEEQLCISKCVEKIDPTIICGSSQEGETGNSVCQKCAEECVTYILDLV